jgi:serine/threonine protein kinase/Tfp pilus assembly protein PilF
MIGTTISHYKILEKLGEGGMGVVYKAEDTKLKRTVALKFFTPQMLGTDEDKTRFLLEAQAAAALDHPNICTVHEIDEADGQTFIAMAYVDGQSLEEKVESGVLDMDEALDIAIQVAEGLKEAHRKGIIHRDIKAANIMVTPDGKAKVMDFGLAKLTGRTRLTKTSTIMGTVAYMSPEQASGKATIDHRTDIWSLGVVLYKMLTGYPPFDAPSDAALIYKIIYEELGPVSSRRSDIPPALEKAIQKMLRKNPQDRPESMQAVIGELKSAKPKELTLKEEATPSIAVLPFVDMSPQKDQEYFCDGMAEALINELTHIEDLKVIARTSAFSFKGKNVNVRDIGRELDVETILEGSVQKAGNRLRITAQLVNTSRGHHLWSERYDRDMDDIFAVQDEISEAIVRKLKPTLVGKEKIKLAGRQAVDIEAYNLYLMGKWHWARLSEEGARRGFEYFARAVEKDPNCALAHAGLADIYNIFSFVTLSPPTETAPKAKEAALKALEIDDTLAEAHSALAFVKATYEWDWSGAEEEDRRSIELRPGDVRLLNVYAFHLMFVGRMKEAVEMINRALELDPLDPILSFSSGILFFYAGRRDKAMKKFRNAIEMVPDRPHQHTWLGRGYAMKSMYDEAFAEFATEREIATVVSPWAIVFSAEAYIKMGKREKAQEMLDELMQQAEQHYVPPTAVASVHFLLGENDQGFAWMDKALEAHDYWLCYLKVDPLYNTDPPDPRLDIIRKKVGLEK